MDICVAEDAFPRFDLRAPRCWRSHRRMVSRPIPIPMSRRPPTKDSAEAPARLNRSNSSRCGSSRTVAWLRGCRACATAWASVVGGVVTDGERTGNDMGADGSLYAWWSGGARGAPGAHSKRIRLDVGVLYSCFVLFLLDDLSHRWGSILAWVVFSLASLKIGERGYASQVGSSAFDTWIDYRIGIICGSSVGKGSVSGSIGC
jgi:hypothetical protein